mmetsp:Transcript_17121/g.28605  ORF Transcript_17121/g.28605 Transcript_17121/m.28605 type:complete len:228 (+) Transcript_17121:61-744(+)
MYNMKFKITRHLDQVLQVICHVEYVLDIILMIFSALLFFARKLMALRECFECLTLLTANGSSRLLLFFNFLDVFEVVDMSSRRPADFDRKLGADEDNFIFSRRSLEMRGGSMHTSLGKNTSVNLVLGNSLVRPIFMTLDVAKSFSKDLGFSNHLPSSISLCSSLIFDAALFWDRSETLSASSPSTPVEANAAGGGKFFFIFLSLLTSSLTYCARSKSWAGGTLVELL